jgi:hypothetical protein
MSIFVNRETEINDGLKAFQEGKHINIYGIEGIGKTGLLKALSERLLSNQKGTQKIFIPVYVPLNDVQDLRGLLEVIANGIDDDVSAVEPPFFNFHEYLEKKPAEDNFEIIRPFIITFDSVLKTHEILLCLDDTEKVSAEIWERFEDEILRLFLPSEVSETKLRIITAGQRPMRWNFFRMRDHTILCSLGSLDESSTKEMVQALAKQRGFTVKNEPWDTIFKLTQGHPESICIVVEHWTKQYTQPLDGNKLDYAEGIQVLKAQFIEIKVINRLKGTVWEEENALPPGKDILSILQQLVLLPYISNKILRETLHHLFPRFYGEKKPFFFSKLFRALYHKHILEWDEKGEQHRFPPIIRHILREDLRENDLKEFERLEKELKELTEGEHIYV